MMRRTRLTRSRFPADMVVEELVGYLVGIARALLKRDLMQLDVIAMRLDVTPFSEESRSERLSGSSFNPAYSSSPIAQWIPLT